MTTPVQEALALTWAQLLDACSAAHAADKRKVHVEHIVIAGKTRAIVRPAKGNARFGLVVEAPEEARDTDRFWAYDKDEHLERFQKLVEAGLVHREVRP